MLRVLTALRLFLRRGYPKDSYDECIEIAKCELQQNARPTVKGDIAIEDYDVVFIGSPQWWGEPPMSIYTFIEKHDWTGKTVIPFVTHEGSDMGGTDRKIAGACEGADVAINKADMKTIKLSNGVEILFWVL